MSHAGILYSLALRVFPLIQCVPPGGSAKLILNSSLNFCPPPVAFTALQNTFSILRFSNKIALGAQEHNYKFPKETKVRFMSSKGSPLKILRRMLGAPGNVAILFCIKPYQKMCRHTTLCTISVPPFYILTCYTK